MEKTILNVKVNKDLKESAREVARDLGLPLGTIINSYLRRLVDERRVEIVSHPMTNKEGYYVIPISNIHDGFRFFKYIFIIHDRSKEGYKYIRYDAEGMDEEYSIYYIDVPEKRGDIYISVGTYGMNIVPMHCTTG